MTGLLNRAPYDPLSGGALLSRPVELLPPGTEAASTADDLPAGSLLRGDSIGTSAGTLSVESTVAPGQLSPAVAS